MALPQPPPRPFPVPTEMSREKLRVIVDYYSRLITDLSELEPKSKSPGKLDLLSLDTFRHLELPARVGSRAKEGSNYDIPIRSEDARDILSTHGWINLEELKQLMEWKLRRGTNRPMLRKLIASNPDETVKTATRTAFALCGPESGTSKNKSAAFKKLQEMRGVGPATASLLLSVAFPDHVPFFSDELYAWVVDMKDKDAGPYPAKGLEDPETKANGTPWQKKLKLKYDLKEYNRIIAALEDIQDRMTSPDTDKSAKVGVTDIEKAAFVITRADQASLDLPSVDLKAESHTPLETGQAEAVGRKRRTPSKPLKEGTSIPASTTKKAKSSPQPRREMPRRAAKAKDATSKAS